MARRIICHAFYTFVTPQPSKYPLMRLLIFNPENDLALASNDPHYTPPASARQMAADLQDLPRLWAGEGDVVIRRAAPCSPYSPETNNTNGGPTFNFQLSTLYSQLSTFNFQLSARPAGTLNPSRAFNFQLILPWGWSPLLVRQLRERGVPATLLPTAGQLAAYRTSASRETAVRLLRQLRTAWPEAFQSGALVGESAWCTSEADVLRSIADYGGTAMLKAPWSGSGRGVHPVHELPLPRQTLSWVRRTLQTQGGVEVEPLYHKVQDLAMEFWAEGGRVRYEGLSLFETTDGGVYAGNLVATEPEKEARLASYLSPTLLHDVRDRLTQLLNEAGLPTWYTGPLGIDMMIVAPSPTFNFPLGPQGRLTLQELSTFNSQPSTLNFQLSARPAGTLDPSRTSNFQLSTSNFQLHPLVEINLRMTMGWVALQLTSRLPDGETGTFSVRRKDGRYQALFSGHSV